MTEDHNKAQAAPDKEKDKSSNQSEDDEEEVRECADDLEDEVDEIEVQDMIELGNMITIDKIVGSFVETAFHEMNLDVEVPDAVCHEYSLKDEIFNNRE